MLDNMLYYVPTCPYQFLCPWHVSKQHHRFNSLCGKGLLTIKDTQGTIAYNKHTSLPTLPTVSVLASHHGLVSIWSTPPMVPTVKGNLTPSQHVKLILHECFNHVSWSVWILGLEVSSWMLTRPYQSVWIQCAVRANLANHGESLIPKTTKVSLLLILHLVQGLAPTKWRPPIT